MIDSPWRILCVDDEADAAAEVKEYLEGESLGGEGAVPVVDTEIDFHAALERLARTRYDLVILDVRADGGVLHEEEDAGVQTLRAIQEQRFLPVVFFTNIPHLVRELESPVIRVVEKAASVEVLLSEVREVMRNELPMLNRVLVRHVESVQRDYMWSFVAKEWAELGASHDRTGLAWLLSRRLAVSLSGSGVDAIVKQLGGTPSILQAGRVEPMAYYILPPVELSPLAGDVFIGTVAGVKACWLLVTPSCDMARQPPHAEWVLLAQCLPLEAQSEFAEWSNAEEPSKTATKKLLSLMADNRQDGQRDRFFFLPAALTLPHQVVDFQRIIRIPWDELSTLSRVASLDSPFGEVALSRFARYFSRLGKPDLNVQGIIDRLER